MDRLFIVTLIGIFAIIIILGYAYDLRHCCQCGSVENNCCPCPNDKYFNNISTWFNGTISSTSSYYYACEEYKKEKKYNF